MAYSKSRKNDFDSRCVLAIKGQVESFRVSTGGLLWLQSHPVASTIFLFIFFIILRGEMKIHMAKLSEPGFYGFKARRNPGETGDLCQMAVGCIPSAPVTFTIFLSDLSRRECQAAAFLMIDALSSQASTVGGEDKSSLCRLWSLLTKVNWCCVTVNTTALLFSSVCTFKWTVNPSPHSKVRGVDLVGSTQVDWSDVT